jgi:hypothetical protein
VKDLGKVNNFRYGVAIQILPPTKICEKYQKSKPVLGTRAWDLCLDQPLYHPPNNHNFILQEIILFGASDNYKRRPSSATF